MNLVFSQFKNAYRYNSDSLLLYDFVAKNKINGCVLDLGCGCGIIGILLKHKFIDITLSLLDILEQNCELTSLNLKQNDIKATVFCADLRNLKLRNHFDFIVCNPPFYRLGAYKSENKHKEISKFQSSLSLDDFLAYSYKLLKAKGVLYFCYSSDCLQDINAKLTQYKLRLSKICFVHKDVNSKARLVLIEAKKGSKAMCEVKAPFIMYEDGKQSKLLTELLATLRIKSNDL